MRRKCWTTKPTKRLYCWYALSRKLSWHLWLAAACKGSTGARLLSLMVAFGRRRGDGLHIYALAICCFYDFDCISIICRMTGGPRTWCYPEHEKLFTHFTHLPSNLTPKLPFSSRALFLVWNSGVSVSRSARRWMNCLVCLFPLQSGFMHTHQHAGSNYTRRINKDADRC